MDLVNAYLNSGQEVPQHVLNSLDASDSSSTFRSGLMFGMIGLGWIVTFNVMGAEEFAALGFIPLFLGFGRLIFWFFDERKRQPNPASNTNEVSID